MNKRPHEDECDDAALLPSVKKPHTDFSDLLNDKSSSTLDKNSTPEKAKPEGMNLSSKWFICSACYIKMQQCQWQLYERETLCNIHSHKHMVH